MNDPNQEVTGAPAADESPTQDSGKEKLGDPPITAQPPAPTAGAAQVPSLGRIVIVREAGKKDAPGIIAELSEDETEHEQTITCNVFRGDHIPHVASRLAQIDAKSTGTGWFFPPRV